MPGSNRYTQIAAKILKAPDLESFVRDNFTGETLDSALQSDHEKYDLYSANTCENILNKHGKEIEEFIPREVVISSIQNSGKYDRDFVPICQVHDAIYETMHMIREAHEDIINANPAAPLTELIAEDTPEHLQVTDNFKKGEKLKNYVARCYLGRDIFRAAIIYQRPVTEPTAQALYEQFNSDITETLNALPAEKKTPWSESITDKVNLALMQTALTLYQEHRNTVLKNPGENLAAALIDNTHAR